MSEKLLIPIELASLMIITLESARKIPAKIYMIFGIISFGCSPFDDLIVYWMPL